MSNNARKYKQQYGECQYWQAVRGVFCPFRKLGTLPPASGIVASYQVDHIWGKRGHPSAVEHPSNYMACHPICHQWKTLHDVAGRIVACHYKLALARSSGDWNHFDRDVIREVFGRDVVSWVEYKRDTVELPEWCDRMALDFLEMIDAKEPERVDT